MGALLSTARDYWTACRWFAGVEAPGPRTLNIFDAGRQGLQREMLCSPSETIRQAAFKRLNQEATALPCDCG